MIERAALVVFLALKTSTLSGNMIRRGQPRRLSRMRASMGDDL